MIRYSSYGSTNRRFPFLRDADDPIREAYLDLLELRERVRVAEEPNKATRSNARRKRQKVKNR